MKPRQKLLKTYFVDQNIMTKFKLFFLEFASKEIMEAINFFEESSVHFHLIRSKMESLLRNQLTKFLKNSAVEEEDKENNVVGKSANDLLDLDLDDKNFYKAKKRVKIGEKCNELMRNLGLTPESPQMSFLMDRFIQFHKAVAKQFMKYFRQGLESPELAACASLGPKARKGRETRRKIMYLANSYKKVVGNIQQADGMDSLEKDLENYLKDDELDGAGEADLNFVEHWERVDAIKEGDWPKYEVLPRFALALATIFNSNSECERNFSHQTRLARDPTKNKMSQKMFDAHLQIRSGVESKDSKRTVINVLKLKLKKM